MYKAHLFAKNFEINEQSVWITFWPDFRQDVDLHSPNNKYYTDGDEVILKGNNYYRSDKWAYVPENATWLLVEESDKSYHLHVTWKTKEIVSPLGDEFNKKINGYLKEARREYSRRKSEEIRLYFYDSSKSNLRLVEQHYYSRYKYILGRLFCNCSIDKKFEIPSKDCFILGRINKTIGARNGDLHDFIEPVYRFFLDFEKDEYDFSLQEYKSNIEMLSDVLMELLCFTIQKEYNMNSIYTKRVVTYIQNKKSNVVPEKAIKMFIEEIKKAFDEENVEKIRNLYDVLNNMMDCSNEKFKVRYIFIDTAHIEYQNGEEDYVNKKWIVLNRDRCTNAKCNYSVRYNEYQVDVID